MTVQNALEEMKERAFAPAFQESAAEFLMGRRKTEHGRGGYALYPVGLGKLKKLRSSQNDEDCAVVFVF